ncbi:MAG: flagellar protein FlgN [Peptococcaceae bacterium]|nr:flagellar protein FlgN [Peptococcaceae bacterium]
MQSQISTLYDVLEQQKEILQQMVRASEREIEAFKNNDIDALTSAVETLSRLSDEMSRLEEERRQAQRPLESALKLQADASMRELISALPEELRSGLESLYRDMTGLVHDLKESNAICRVLSTRALQFNNALMRAVGAVEGATYEPGGQLKAASKPCTLNKSV